MIKKGQMEIMGLVVIVILVVLAFLIFLAFNKPKQELSEDFFLKTTPTKVLQTMLITSTDCNKQDLRTLISDVASQSFESNGEVSYNNNRLIKCSQTKTSEDVIKEVIPIIFKNSLESSFLDYEFEINIKDSYTLYKLKSEKGCKRARKVFADTFYISSDKGSVELFLKIC